MRVLNASGVDGAAATPMKGLKTLGFRGVGTGNADRQLQTTEVHYVPGSEDHAALVAGYVTGPVQVVSDDSVEGADVTLWVGGSFGGIAARRNPGRSRSRSRRCRGLLTAPATVGPPDLGVAACDVPDP